MKKARFVVLFLILNLGSLAIGSWLMNNGPRTQWYLLLNKAPWTPPGWLFGVAWTLIMICFSFYLANLFDKIKSKSKATVIAYIVQVLLNIGWNYIFFNLHQIQLGLLILLMLNIVLCYFYFSISTSNSKNRYLLLPYMIWMLIATSLNLYVVIHN